MAIRSKNKKKTTKKKINKELSNKIKRLETDLKYTVKSIDGNSEQLDTLFTNQAKRIMVQIGKLKQNQ